MVLGADRIIELVKSGVEVETPEGKKAVKPLVEGMSDSQIAGIEGTTVDLRVGALFKPVSGSKLHCDARVTPKIECVADIAKGDRFYTIKPGEYLLAQTIETVNLPDSIFAALQPRTTMFRSGLFVGCDLHLAQLPGQTYLRGQEPLRIRSRNGDGLPNPRLRVPRDQRKGRPLPRSMAGAAGVYRRKSREAVLRTASPEKVPRALGQRAAGRPLTAPRGRPSQARRPGWWRQVRYPRLSLRA